jgi:hypothetical protein
MKTETPNNSKKPSSGEQNSTDIVTEMHIVLQSLISIMNGLTLKIQVGTILTLVMLASAATVGGCHHV